MLGVAPPREMLALQAMRANQRRADPFLLFEPTSDESPERIDRVPRGSGRSSRGRTERPANVGLSGAQFTSSRLIPANADLSTPYRAIGRLMFTGPNGADFICTAAVVAPRLILTAGHCVHSGSGGRNGYFRNFMFVPAYRNGAAPFGTWDWSGVVTTNTWIAGGGAVPNAADYALIEMRDQVLQGALRRLGEVTGGFATKTLSLYPNHVHMFGYPTNLDQAGQIHQVTAESFALQAPNNVVFGTDMGPGSSGGPLIQNFGVRSQGQTGGLNSAQNAVVGVVSSGPANNADLRYMLASIFDSRLTNLFAAACAARPGNCCPALNFRRKRTRCPEASDRSAK